jgi:hypothetical protein
MWWTGQHKLMAECEFNFTCDRLIAVLNPKAIYLATIPFRIIRA